MEKKKKKYAVPIENIVTVVIMIKHQVYHTVSVSVGVKVVVNLSTLTELPIPRSHRLFHSEPILPIETNTRA